MNTDQRLERIETTLDAMQKAMSKLQPLPTLTDEHSPEVVRPQWEAIPQEEKDAGWWWLEFFALYGGAWEPCRCSPAWSPECQYRIVKTERHPDNDRHARTKLEWKKVRSKGTHYLWCQPSKGVGYCPAANQLWDKEASYEVRRYEDVPIAKKRIDKSKLPIGAMTNWGRVMDRKRNDASCWDRTNATYFEPYSSLRIVPMTKWEVLQDGDVIPEGLLGEVRVAWLHRHQGDPGAVKVYRITGIADGWSDE